MKSVCVCLVSCFLFFSVFSCLPALADPIEVHRFTPPWEGGRNSDKYVVREGNADGNSVTCLETGIVVVFEVTNSVGAANSQRYQQFHVDPREIGGAGIYHVTVTYYKVASNFDFGGPGAGAHGGWVHLFLDYDGHKEKHKKVELISPHQTLIVSSVTLALEAWGAVGASEIATGAKAIWDGISLWSTISDIESSLNEGIRNPVTMETDITVRNPEAHIDVGIGAEVNGSGVGLAQLNGGLVAAVFTEVKFEKTEDITPIAEIEILTPRQGMAVYRDAVDSLPITIRIRDDEGKTNEAAPMLALDGGGAEYGETKIDVPKGQWITETIWTVDLNALDPDSNATGGYVYVPAYYYKDKTGYYTCTDRNDFYFRYRKPPNKPCFIDAPAECFETRDVSFEAVTLDPDSNSVYYRFAWGDGDSTGWLGPAAYGYSKSGTHTYDSTGTYHVTAQAKDTDEMLSEWSESSAITVNNLLALEVSPRLWPTSMFWGDTCRLSIAASDPSLGEDSSRFWIDWGDESAPIWTEDYYAEDERVAFYHSYDDTVGIAHIRVKAADAVGETSSVVTRDIMIMAWPPRIDSTRADGSSVIVEWSTITGQKVLASCTAFYSSDPSPYDSVEIPVPINPYEPVCTAYSLAGDTRYWFWVEETYISDDTTTASSYAVPAFVDPSPPEIEFRGPGEDTLSGTVTVEWEAIDDDPDETLQLTMHIDYSRSGGAWTDVGAEFDGANDGSFLWDTREVDDGEYVLRVIAEDPAFYADTAFSDTMTVDNPDAPEVTIASPSAGDRWGGEHEITWGASDDDGDSLTIHIEYSKNGGQTWGLISTGESNDGTYTWNTASHWDSDEFIIRVVAEDPGELLGEHVSGIFTVDNTPPLDFWFSSFVASWDSVNAETVDLAWPAAFEPLSDPVRYYIYWGASAATVDTLIPVLVTKATNCTLTGLPTGSSYFLIAAEDSVDEPNYSLNSDPQCVYFTHTGAPSDNSLAGIVSQSNGVVTGTAPDFQLDGSVVVIGSDALIVSGDTCAFNDTTGNACIRSYGLLRATSSAFQAQSPGDWRGIVFEDQSTDYGGGGGCMIDTCTVRHAVDGISSMTSSQLIDRSDISYNSHAGINCYESNSTVMRNDIYSNDYGIYCDREAPVGPVFIDISSNDIHENYVSGMHFGGGARPLIADNLIHDNENGSTWATGAFPFSFNLNDIYWNAAYGVINYDGTVVVNAAQNWWGHASGPSGAAPGWGDAINSVTRVLYIPFLTTPVRAPAVDWAALQGPLTMSMSPGLTDPIYGEVYEHGVTEGAGQGGGIEVEFGYGPDETHPGYEGWVWLTAWYVGDQGDNDEYSCETEIFTPGLFDYCFRYSMDGESWIYGDHDGNDTGDGGTNDYSIAQAGDLTVTGGPTIILVDDDGGSAAGDVFDAALSDAGLSFDLWDVDSQGPPTDTDLMEHDIVIWNTGETSSQTLTSLDENRLAYFLGQGGSLFLSSQGYLSDIGSPSDFSTNFLHVTDWTDDVGAMDVEGVSGDPITDGMVYALYYPFANASDNLEPDSLAAAIFIDTAAMEPSALRYPSEGSSYYKVVFMAFPFEAIPDSSSRATFMNLLADWLAPPCIPTLFDPPDSTVHNDALIEFSWGGTAGVGGRYTLEYALDSVFTVGVTTALNITDTTYAIPITSPLSDSTYYWHVKAIDAGGLESDYQPRPFTLVADYIPAVPQLLSPPDSAATKDPTPELIWSYVETHGGSFALEYALDAYFLTGLVTVSGLTETTYTVSDSLSDADYYWHVEAISALGYDSGFAPGPSMFSVDTGLPAVPVLIEPEDTAGVGVPRPELVWSSTAAGGGTYTVQYAGDSTFTTGLVTVSGLTESTYTIADSLPDAAYCWHVEAVDAADNRGGYQSHPFSFTVDTEVPAVPHLGTPDDSTTVNDCEPTFAWNSTAGHRGTYTLQYACDDVFTHGLCTVHGLSDTTFTISYPFPHLVDTTYYWHVEAMDLSENESGYQALPYMFYVGAAGVDRPEPPAPATFSLSQNYPNPFASATTIRYALPRECHVKIAVYNVLGQRVAVLVDGMEDPGLKHIRWQPGSLASGIYFCHMRAGDFKQTRKMLLLK